MAAQPKEKWVSVLPWSVWSPSPHGHVPTCCCLLPPLSPHSQWVTKGLTQVNIYRSFALLIWRNSPGDCDVFLSSPHMSHWTNFYLLPQIPERWSKLPQITELDIGLEEPKTPASQFCSFDQRISTGGRKMLPRMGQVGKRPARIRFLLLCSVSLRDADHRGRKGLLANAKWRVKNIRREHLVWFQERKKQIRYWVCFLSPLGQLQLLIKSCRT